MFAPEEDDPQARETPAEAVPGQAFVPGQQPGFAPVGGEQPEAYGLADQPQFASAEPEPGQAFVPPAQPQYAPAQPQYAPAQPQYAPAQPQYAPAQPQYAPAQPQYAPAQQAPAYLEIALPAESYPFRLLQDEEVMGSYPITRMSRPLGKLASYIFVTDSRVIYSAESKTLTSSSYHSREFAISSVQGVDVQLHRGFDSFGAALMAGIFLNLVVTTLASVSGSSNLLPFAEFASFAGFLAFFTLIVGVIAFFVLRSPSVRLSLLSQQKAVPVSTSDDTFRNRLRIILLVVFVFVAPVIVLLWLGSRQLGLFRVEDAFGFANPEFVDRISRELGAHIIDIQSSGKMAEKR
jgi:hypothetical protein